jgi:hypothetical protein
VAAGRAIHPTCAAAERRSTPTGTPQDGSGTVDAGDAEDADMRGALPLLGEVMATRVRTLKHIPKKARQLWAQALTQAIALVNETQSVEAWTQLMMLPKATLLAPPRGGKRHRAQAATYTLDRLACWQAGERATLWEDVTGKQSQKRQKPETSEDRRKRAEALCREGFDRKACASLISNGILPESPDTRDALKKLHPAKSAPTCPVLSTLPAAEEIPLHVVEKVLKSFPLDSAPGPSGLRIQHLLEALTPATRTPLLEQITALSAALAQGAAPSEVAPHLAGAGLMALSKPSGGVRPIAIGEIWRRIVGKSLCAQVKELAQAFFPPLQVGVACPLGVDAAVHVCRAWCLRNAGDQAKGIVKLDFENAFNSVDRAQFLEKVREDFPGLARWTQWTYGDTSNLLFGDYCLGSETGVQQGDPLGPLLFSLVIQPLAKELQQLTHNNKKLDLTFFYLDDGVIAGDLEVVAAALRLVEQRGHALGLKLKVSKSELVLTASASNYNLTNLFPQSLLTDPETGNSRVLLEGNFELLGAAIGDASSCEAHTSKRVHTATKLLEELKSLEDPQVALRLLRNCAGVCRVNHSMRLTEPRLHLSALTEFDNKVRDTFSHIAAAMPSEAQWNQACCCLSLAGLGLRKASRHAPAAFLASTCASRERCHSLDAAYHLEASNPTSAVGQALAMHNSKLPENDTLSPGCLPSAKQKNLSAALDKAAFVQRYDAECPANQATLLSEGEKGAREFWHAVPHSSRGTVLSPEEFRAEIRYRLCVPESLESGFCPLCDDCLDPFGHHCRRCCAGGDRTIRHNAIRNIIFNLCCKAGLRPELEKPGLFLPARPSDSSSERRPADIYLPCWSGGLPAALDFAVTAPQRQAIVGEAARTPLAAASAYMQSKRDHLGTQEACATQGIRFQPMVCETSGAWAPEALEVLQLICKTAAARTGTPHSELLQETLSRCGAAVHRANARAHFKRHSH